MLKVDSLGALMEIIEKSMGTGILNTVVADRGLTQIEAGSITCMAIGPDLEENIDRITGGLKLL